MYKVNPSVEPSSQLRETSPSWHHKDIDDVNVWEHCLGKSPNGCPVLSFFSQRAKSR